MTTKAYRPEQIVTLVRGVDEELANGKAVDVACR